LASTPLLSTFIAIMALSDLSLAQGAHTEAGALRSAPVGARSESNSQKSESPESNLKALTIRPSRGNVSALAHARAAHSAGQIFYDTPGDGSIWARGENYKAGFTAQGACMIPFLGASAPANRPLRLSPDSISIGGMPVSFERSVTATRAGDAISFDRRAFIEKYAVAASSIEQTFVFAELPSRGDLVLRLRVETDLDTRNSTSEGLRFECDRGGVSYGRATAVDALGKHTPVESFSENGFIELRVPAAFVDSASLPLTIDPVISTFAVVTLDYLDNYLPDVAYDPSTDTYMVCMEQQFSATDHDVIEELLDSSGGVLSFQYIDAGSDNWQHPRIADNASASQFMVVAQFGSAPSRGIISRTASAGTNVVGNKVFVNLPNGAFDQVNPVIGGNPGTSPNNLYLVVWEFAVQSTGERDIVQTGMHTNGLPDGGPTCIDCSPTTHDFNPAISKSCGSSPGLYDVWNVVWESEFSPSDHDIWGIQQYNELGITAPFPINTSIYDDRHPTVSSFTEEASTPGNYLVAYDEDFGPEHDILGQVMNTGSSLAFASLTYLEGPTFSLQDQVSPSADSDGNTFAVAYSESYSTSLTDYDIYIATFNLVGNTIDCTEPHQNLAYTGFPERDVRITASHGGPPLHYFASWTQATAVGNGDIYGGLYGSPLIVSYCQPGLNGVATCPCNNPPTGGGGGCNNSIGTGGAVLYGAGTPLLSADSFVLGQQGELASALSIFLQGNANAMTGVTFGDGVRCVAGSLKRLYVHNASAGGAIAPVGSDSPVSVRPSALGDTIHACQTRFYQVYYRDSNLGFCAGGFNIGSGLKVTWLP
jgi:hypothetical protein